MATITTCPKCGEKLRLPDNLLGQRVRCPQCTNVFEATAPPAPPPVPVSHSAGDIPLQLSLDDPDPDPPAPLPAADVVPRSKPVGAVEINLSLDNNEPAPAARQADSSPRKPTPLPDKTPSGRGDRSKDTNGDRQLDDDKTTCPVCHRKNKPTARRCFHCGERLADGPRSGYPDRDRFDDYGPSRRRRDTEPHRGGVVLAMGIISLAGTFVIGGVPIIFGIIGWIMGQSDLRKMRNNQMDPDGEGTTRAGWVCSILGTILNGGIILFCCGFMGLLFTGTMDGPAARPRTTRMASPIFVPAQPVTKDFNKDFIAPQDKEFKDFKDFPRDK